MYCPTCKRYLKGERPREHLVVFVPGLYFIRIDPDAEIEAQEVGLKVMPCWQAELLLNAKHV